MWDLGLISMSVCLNSREHAALVPSLSLSAFLWLNYSQYEASPEVCAPCALSVTRANWRITHPCQRDGTLASTSQHAGGVLHIWWVSTRGRGKVWSHSPSLNQSVCIIKHVNKISISIASCAAGSVSLKWYDCTCGHIWSGPWLGLGPVTVSLNVPSSCTKLNAWWKVFTVSCWRPRLKCLREEAEHQPTPLHKIPFDHYVQTVVQVSTH